MTIYFRRGWWKPWNWSTRNWLVAIFVSLIAFPFVSRWICLWQIPDVTLPFDVEEVILADIPESKNAFVGYQLAIQKFRNHETSWSKKAIADAIEAIDTNWDDRLDQWLIDCREALEDFLRSSDLEEGRGQSLRTIHFNSHITPLQELRELARLSAAEAIRYERSGDFDRAWKWHRAILRSAHHAEMQRFAMACAFAIAIRNYECQGIANWASQPSLEAEQLRSARNEVAIETSKRRPLSEFAKVHYLCDRNTARRFDGLNMVFPNWDSNGPSEPILLAFKHFKLWMIGQPELSLRLVRQLLVNNVGQLDLPLHLRQKSVRANELIVIDLDPQVPRLSGQLSPAQLNVHLGAELSQLLIKENVLYPMGSLDVLARSDNARLSAINVLLACHEYRRILGEFPATIEQLIPTFLDVVPFDSMDATGAPLRYRRGENGDAFVWSIGRDGTDDGGDFAGNAPKDLGYRLHIKKESDPQSSETKSVSKEIQSEITEEVEQ